MPELPRISGSEAIKVFESLGFSVVRQRGSHVVLRKGNSGCVVPVHKELAIGTLRSAIRQAGIMPDDFVTPTRADNRRYYGIGEELTEL
jgi:predicted RNA binding protein YcfA (HicA-like mRNA interferase family)